MKTIIVGFGHKARQGKDWLAAEVRSLIPRDAKSYAFADDIKQLARLLGMQGKQSNFLQQLGAAMRTLDEAYWIRKVAQRIEEDAPAIALITDVRFRNEAEWIRHRGGHVYRVCRLQDGAAYTASDRDPNHVSETDLDTYTRWTRTLDIEDGDVVGMKAAAQLVLADIQKGLEL